MILQKIRTCLPERIRTEEQDMLIGDTCLALTDKERKEIENLNFESYQYNSPQRAEISARVADAVYKAQLAGAATRAAVGALGGGALAWKTTSSVPLTALAGAAGGLTGGVTGYYAGEKLGHARVITDIKNSPEYHKWRNEKYETIIFPALSRYMDPNQWEDFQLICPITHNFMLEPVQATDGHIYDKSAILAHLAVWQGKWNSLDRLLLSTERQTELWMSSSPFRAGHVTANTLEPLPDYYKNIFDGLVHNYNSKVLTQKSIVDLAKEEYGPLTEKAEKIVKLYSMNQRRRRIIGNEMTAALLRREEISDEEFKVASEFLGAAAELPKELLLIE
ncbi:MAG: U-box domain-containing protein [Candidatus Rhabdochlamydia sp.]